MRSGAGLALPSLQFGQARPGRPRGLNFSKRGGDRCRECDRDRLPRPAPTASRRGRECRGNGRSKAKTLAGPGLGYGGSASWVLLERLLDRRVKVAVLRLRGEYFMYGKSRGDPTIPKPPAAPRTLCRRRPASSMTDSMPLGKRRAAAASCSSPPISDSTSGASSRRRSMRKFRQGVHAPERDPHRLIVVIVAVIGQSGWVSVTRTISRAPSRASCWGTIFHPPDQAGSGCQNGGQARLATPRSRSGTLLAYVRRRRTSASNWIVGTSHHRDITISQAIRKASRIAPGSATLLPAISKAVPCAGVVMIAVDRPPP